MVLASMGHHCWLFVIARRVIDPQEKPWSSPVESSWLWRSLGERSWDIFPASLAAGLSIKVPSSSSQDLRSKTTFG